MSSEPSAAAPTRTKMEDIEAQDENGNPMDEDAKKKQAFERSLWTKIWQGLAVACIVTYAASFAIYDFTIALMIGAIFGFMTSVSVITYEAQLADLDSLRNVQNQLRHQVNDFAGENDKLTSSNEKLQKELEPLKETAAELDRIAAETGCQVDKLKKIVMENQSLLNQMKESVESDIISQMMAAVLDSERNGDGEFNDAEIRRLAIRLAGLPAIKVDKEKFLAKLQKTKSINAVFSLVQTITDKNIPADQRIFTINEDEIDYKKGGVGNDDDY